MDADEQRGRFRQVLPALDLHPEPVIHQRIPEVFLALEEVPIGAVEREMGRSVRYQTRWGHGGWLPGRTDYNRGQRGSFRTRDGLRRAVQPANRTSTRVLRDLPRAVLPRVR